MRSIRCAVYPFEFLPRLHLGKGTQAAYERLRSEIPSLETDRYLSPDIALIEDAMLQPAWLTGIEAQLK